MAVAKKLEDIVAPEYKDTYGQQLKDTYDKITNRGPFTYDVNGDALYQQYRDKYIQGGKMAMKDTMGQAAALTGGYGSSYGQAVGQQQYDAYLQSLNDVVPQLYESAYTKYRDQGADLEKQYAMLGQQAQDEYAKYRDLYSDYRNQLSDYYTEQAWQAQQAETAYKHQQDEYNKLYNLITMTGYKPSSAELKAAGMTNDAYKALLNVYKKANPSGGGGGGGGYSGTPKTQENDLAALVAQYELENGINNNGNNGLKISTGTTQQAAQAARDAAIKASIKANAAR